MASNPRVTVLMPIYNGKEFLREAIDSILKQTFSDFDFLMIDDGSTDGSVAIIQSYADPRIHLVHNGNHAGLAESLNKGLDLARGEYVARMDCDDISRPQRFARQVAFMDRHSHVGVCGTWVKTVGKLPGEMWRHPTDPEIARCQLLFESVIAHPSAMMRRKLFEQAGLSYSPLYTCAQDYDLWVRCAKRFAIANIAKFLLLRREHSQQLGVRDQEGQRAAAAQIRFRQIEELGIHPTKIELEVHQSISLWEFHRTKEFIMQADGWLQKLKVANEKTGIYPQAVFSRVLAERWFAVCKAASVYGLLTWKMFWRSPLSATAALSWKKKLGLRASSLKRFAGL